MSNFLPGNFRILFNGGWNTKGLSETISNVDRNALFEEYEELRRCAPRRSECYFIGHDGRLSTESRGSNRFEEHLAIALWRLKGCWPRPDGTRFRLLDYQFPLKAQRSDSAVGKVDLLGVTDQGRLMVIELKVKPQVKNSRGECPAAALMQGLRYAAIVEANGGAIAAEAAHSFNVNIVGESPIVQILAPKAWWRGWFELGNSTRKAAGRWEPEFVKLARDVEKKLGVVVECLALDDLHHADITSGADGKWPQLGRATALYPVRIDIGIGEALPPHRPER